MSAEKRIYINAYNGPTTERTPLDCANEWRKLGLGSIDSLLSEQLLAAMQNGKNKVTVLDIGSGKEAKLLRAVMHDQAVAPESRRLLSQYPEASLQLVGLTDTSEEPYFGQTIISETMQEPDMRVTFRNVAYTLTAAQTLRCFLRQEEIIKINLALATWSLAYLPLGIFSEVVRTTTEHLESEGRFLGVGYNDNVSGIGFKYHPDRDVVHFSVASRKLPSDLWEVLLDDFSEDYSRDRYAEASPNVKNYIRRVVSSPSMQMDSDRKRQLVESTNQASTLTDLQSVTNALKDPMRRLWEYKFSEVFKPAKEIRLNEIESANPAISVERVSPNLFSIRKQ